MKKNLSTLILVFIIGYLFYENHKYSKLNSESLNDIKELTFELFRCVNDSKKSNSFIFHNNEDSLILKLDNNKNYLEFDTPTKASIILNNADKRNVKVLGTGIRFLSVKNNTVQLEINVPSEFIKTDTLDIKVWFDNQTTKNVNFYIPIKKQN